MKIYKRIFIYFEDIIGRGKMVYKTIKSAASNGIYSVVFFLALYFLLELIRVWINVSVVLSLVLTRDSEFGILLISSWLPLPPVNPQSSMSSDRGSGNSSGFSFNLAPILFTGLVTWLKRLVENMQQCG